MGKNKRKANCLETKTIGIVSAGRHTGATHLTICLANLLCSVRGERVAVLEWNSHRDFARIEQLCTGTLGIEKPFRLLDVDYYKEAGSREWEQCMLMSYDWMIIDYGEADEATLYECGRCERRIMLGSLTEWQQSAFLDQITAEKKWNRGLLFAVTFGSEEFVQTTAKRLRISLYQIPLSVDAFAVTIELFSQLTVFFRM